MKIENPYAGADQGTWLRGNLHAHTNASDGRSPIQEVLSIYAKLGYDFLMISDHDILTVEADYAKLDAGGMILVPGNEVTRDGPHLLHVGAERRVAPNPDRQQVIDAINAGPGFVVMNHPNWQQHFNHCSFDQLSTWKNYLGMEIYNGVIGRLDGSPFATDKWDRLLSSGRRVWGFANDDSHAPDRDIALGWNMVAAPERNVAGIMDAFRRGWFYASTGVTIRKVTVTDNRIRVETGDADRIVASRQWGMEFAIVDAPIIEVEVPPEAKYVRFECRGRGGRMAWTQPFHVSAD